MIQKLRDRLKGIQAQLSFESWSHEDYPNFASRKGIGRIAVMGSVLGIVLGIHVVLFLILSLRVCVGLSLLEPLESFLGLNRLQLAWQWCAYFASLCVFHFLEFFVTCIYNPTQASSDSFLVNHSTAYTAAALASWIAFGLRYCFLPWLNVWWLSVVGTGIVVVAQFIRSVAMATAGESFNHLIQNVKKDNHELITHGVYHVLRHPSYVGFFYWSIAMQLVLGNLVLAVVFGVVSWKFFKRRIAYEEESLRHFFPDTYPDYVNRSYMAIPFLKTKISVTQTKKTL